MLILTRRIGESIMIGNNGEISVTVLGVKGNQVRLGVNAPKEVSVHREEIFRRIQQEESTGSGDPLVIDTSAAEKEKGNSDETDTDKE